MQAQREATDAKVVSVLTDEQAAKYAEIKQRGRDRGQERGDIKGHKRGPKSPKQDGCKNCECNKSE